MFRHSSRIRLFYDSIHLLHQGSPGGTTNDARFRLASGHVASQSARARLSPPQARCALAAPLEVTRARAPDDRDVPRGNRP